MNLHNLFSSEVFFYIGIAAVLLIIGLLIIRVFVTFGRWIRSISVRRRKREKLLQKHVDKLHETVVILSQHVSELEKKFEEMREEETEIEHVEDIE